MQCRKPPPSGGGFLQTAVVPCHVAVEADAKRLLNSNGIGRNINTRSIGEQIVWLLQPWISPLVRGKIRVNTEFGAGRRSYGRNRIMAHLPETSFCVIGLALLCMNLAKRRRPFCTIFWGCGLLGSTGNRTHIFRWLRSRLYCKPVTKNKFRYLIDRESKKGDG